MKPLPPEPRGQPADCTPHRWLLREIGVVVAIKLLALGALWLAFFSPAERPPTSADIGRTLLERPAASPLPAVRSTP